MLMQNDAETYSLSNIFGSEKVGRQEELARIRRHSRLRMLRARSDVTHFFQRGQNQESDRQPNVPPSVKPSIEALARKIIR